MLFWPTFPTLLCVSYLYYFFLTMPLFHEVGYSIHGHGLSVHDGLSPCSHGATSCVVFLQFPPTLTFSDQQGSPYPKSSLLTLAITQILPITCSKMNEDGLCVTTQPVYIYFNRYSGEEEEPEEDK